MTLLPILVLAAGTYAFRLAGPLLSQRMQVSARVQGLLSLSAIALLTALVATATLTSNGGFSGWARPAGVLAGAVLAWRKLPFIVVVVGAAGVAALLRMSGVS
ncbi:AzlD domain-containing protein [Myxococcus virescens]|uniref:Branched-chain amino acid transport protein (AzlD) n=1 Tax=Myxococcus virescens TaxID=83456 RepID=A0A511HM50_9BACT|nr:AzlD domain-containing protein [Myxococcus virescens]GEL74662.1 branched-chain amino acid transporter [Myxococcus virescens]SDE55185.1 Branched-chain amino acid transport protein (AzlD) [Myxococcus virescens]